MIVETSEAGHYAYSQVATGSMFAALDSPILSLT